MGEISEALSRARQEEGAETRQAPEGRSPRAPSSSPRSHPPLYDAPPARGERESDMPRHEIGSLRDPAPAPGPPRAESPASSPSAETRYVSIRDDRADSWLYRMCNVEPDSPDAVRFRHFAVRMRAALDAAAKHSVLVTSAIQGEGKTTVAINLALALASIAPKVRIALVDLDLRRGRVARELGSDASVGVDDVLAGRAELDDVIARTSAGRLDILPCAGTNPDAHALFGDNAEGFFGQLHARYDYVICDGPPVLPVPDAPLISKHVGGCLAIVASGRTRHAAFSDLMDLIPRDRWYGVFMNESTTVGSKDRYGYRSHYTSDDDDAAGGDASGGGTSGEAEAGSRTRRVSAIRRAIAAATAAYVADLRGGSGGDGGGAE